MLTWDKTSRKDQAGTVVSEGYKAQVPHWGEASVHPHIHHPGEMFLDCPALGIDMHPLGRADAIDALTESVYTFKTEDIQRFIFDTQAEAGARLAELTTRPIN